MFKALATLARTPRHSPDLAIANDNHLKHAAYMIYRDGSPFLEVNGAEEYASGLLDGFAHQSPSSRWSFEQIH